MLPQLSFLNRGRNQDEERPEGNLTKIACNLIELRNVMFQK